LDERVLFFGGLRFKKLVREKFGVARLADEPVRLASVGRREVVETSPKNAGACTWRKALFGPSGCRRMVYKPSGEAHAWNQPIEEKPTTFGDVRKWLFPGVLGIVRTIQQP
jgi:hypothetical protein